MRMSIHLKWSKKGIMLLQLFGLMAIEAVFIPISDFYQSKSLQNDLNIYLNHKFNEYICILLQLLIIFNSYLTMKVIFLFAFLLSLSISTVVPRVGPIHTHVPRTYRVSLEDSPQNRWRQIIHDYTEPLKRFIDYFDLLPIPESFFHGVEWYAKNVYTQR